MLYNEIFKAIGGFGLFLFSLRFLNTVLTNLISNKLKSFIEKSLSNYLSCTAFGFFTTIFVQASSITIITTMGLLNNSFISLEQSIFIMLGSSLGTTIKGFLFAKNIYAYGSLIIGLTSILLIFIKNQLYRDFLQVLFSIGLAFIGFSIVSESLGPLSREFSHYLVLENNNIIFSILIGIVLATLLQSSSTVLFLTIELTSQNIISLPIGIAIILGSNIGTTSTILFTSLEYGKNVKRLALSYLIVKIIGVFITIIFFPYFLSFVKYISFGSSTGLDIALANTLFNLINVMWWHNFYPIIIKTVFSIIPSDLKSNKKDDENLIGKIISGSTELTFQEIDLQINKAINITKVYTDKIFEIFLSHKKEKYESEFMLDNTEKIRGFIIETLFNMFIRNNFEEKNIDKIRNYIHFINSSNNICNYSIRIIKFIKNGLYIEKYTIPEELNIFVDMFEKEVNNIWLIIVFNKKEEVNMNKINKNILNIEDYFFKIISKNKKLKKENISWIYLLIYKLKTVSNLLHELSKVKI